MLKLASATHEGFLKETPLNIGKQAALGFMSKLEKKGTDAFVQMAFNGNISETRV